MSALHLPPFQSAAAAAAAGFWPTPPRPADEASRFPGAPNDWRELRGTLMRSGSAMRIQELRALVGDYLANETTLNRTLKLMQGFETRQKARDEMLLAEAVKWVEAPPLKAAARCAKESATAAVRELGEHLQVPELDWTDLPASLAGRLHRLERIAQLVEDCRGYELRIARDENLGDWWDPRSYSYSNGALMRRFPQPEDSPMMKLIESASLLHENTNDFLLQAAQDATDLQALDADTEAFPPSLSTEDSAILGYLATHIRDGVLDLENIPDDLSVADAPSFTADQLWTFLGRSDTWRCMVEDCKAAGGLTCVRLPPGRNDQIEAALKARLRLPAGDYRPDVVATIVDPLCAFHLYPSSGAPAQCELNLFLKCRTDLKGTLWLSPTTNAGTESGHEVPGVSKIVLAHVPVTTAAGKVRYEEHHAAAGTLGAMTSAAV
ncbi:hypothetical protein [Ramlibacter sp.]|uniref:hypothetical protein n=1 Tax=Ramlibacter sp. TaxID=1917967 RepID=UPI003D0D3177